MIQANELRIGNLVLDSDRDNPYFYQVVRIETKEYTEWDSGNEFNIVCLLEGTKDSYFEMIPSPIQLTEEWLLRFGFEQFKDMIDKMSPQENFSKKFRIGSIKIFQSNDFFIFLNKEFKIKYVHQLQNLYFALTGQELKLNDK